MRKLSEITIEPSTPEPKQLSVKAASNSVSLQTDHVGKKKLADILGYCFNTLRVYGKEPEQLASANKMFQFILEDYSIDQISSAFKFYFAHNNELPTPSDIVNIIKRGNKPPFDKSIYIALSKKESYQRTFAEDQYVKDYEDFMMNG